MARRHSAKPPGPAASATLAGCTDVDGRPTDDPAAIVRGEIVERDTHGRTTRRTPFFLTEREMPLPVSEPAFLLWMLAALIAIWLVIGLVVLT